MARPRKVVEVESKGAPEPQNDTRNAVQEEAPVSVEVNDEPVAVEEDVAEGVDPEVEVAPDEKAEASNEVLFADEGVSIHILMNPTPMKDNDGNELYDVRGQVLRPGDTVPLNELPPYLAEKARTGAVKGARVVSAEDAFRLNREAAQIRAIADQTIGVESDFVSEVVTPVPVS